MSYNEQETRFYLIDPVLREKGYNDHQWLKLETPAPVEPTGTKGRRRKGSGRTDLFGTDFITKPPRPGKGGGGGGEGPGGDPPDGAAPVSEVSGHSVYVTGQGRFIPVCRDGRDTMIPVDEYRREVIREIDDMTDFDLFDFFGHHGYHARALKRPERGELFILGNQDWFAGMERNAATVLKGFGQQFALGGTDALETPSLWDVPEIKRAGGLDALKTVGQPAQVLLDAKGRSFAA